MRYLMAGATVVILMIIMFEVGKLKGLEQGKKQALSTSPVSEELDLICAGLWVGQQNREAVQRGIVK